MRQIEKQMIKAVNNRDNWGLANTQVHTVVEDENTISRVFLHGHHIADFVHGGYGCGWIEPNRETLLEWPTRTTMSRLRALGIDVCTRKGDIYIDGEVVA